MIDNVKTANFINTALFKTIKDTFGDACLLYNQLINETSVKHRQSEKYEEYNLQYLKDMGALIKLRDKSQEIADTINKLIYKITMYSSINLQDELNEEIAERINNLN